MPNLTAVQATFHAVATKAPGDEIEITVTDSAGDIVAQDTNNYGVFPGLHQRPVRDRGAQPG